MCPVLIQDAAAEPRYRNNLAVRFGLTRYLAAPIVDPGGTWIGTLCFLDNRSDELLGQEDVEFMSLLAMRVSAEIERERMVDARIAEQRAVAARLEEMNARLLQTAEEKRRFIATVIHDLRQPLTALRTLGYVLQQEEEPEQRAECLELFENRVEALAAMVDELLEYARIEAGTVSWRLEEVSLEPLLIECADLFREEAEARRVCLRLDLNADLGVAWTDRTRLGHVVRNLISNAVKFAGRPLPESTDLEEDEGSVVVRAGGTGPDAWTLEVIDNGIGMPEAVRQRVFEEFYQGPHAGAGGEPMGRGLGLAIVKHLCTAMGAGIEVRSLPGQGSAFCLTIPRRHPGAETDLKQAAV